MSRLRQMSVFAHIVHEGSISGAADKLALSKSVVSQHLKSLESELGAVLLKRTTRRQTLTELGKSFYQECQKINTIADQAWEAVSGAQEQVQGVIRITAPNALMDLVVSPIIADLMLRYPKLQPELVSDDECVNLMERNIDLAIRVGHSSDSSLKQRRVGSFRDVLCSKHAVSKADIEHLPYIANQWQGNTVEHVFNAEQGDTFTLRKQPKCRVNSLHSCLSLIKSGAGIGLIPDFYYENVKPSVVQLLPDMFLPENPVFALTPFQENPPKSVSLFIDEIRKRLAS
ncbi:MAG: transcriptional regulator [Colwelliaceae bacterium]|nr:transcriptional regulator [Colwelliaceae bacterium]